MFIFYILILKLYDIFILFLPEYVRS